MHPVDVIQMPLHCGYNTSTLLCRLVDLMATTER